MPLTREMVELAYVVVLGRAPENDAAIEAKLKLKTIRRWQNAIRLCF